jgi:hypothetical protein
MPNILTEGKHAGEFAVSLCDPQYCNEQITVKEYNPANTDGSALPAGILYDAVDASGGDAKGVIVARHAVVNSAELVWFSGASTNQKTTGLAGLALLGIIGR